MLEGSRDLTGPRLRRAISTLQGFPPSPTEFSIEEAVRVAWREAGGPREEVLPIIHLLRDLELIALRGDRLTRTNAGNRIASATLRRDLRPFGLALIRTGRFHDQARVLVERGSSEASGLTCPRRFARQAAPQLLGVLTWWDTVSTYPEVFIPTTLVRELTSFWSLLPPATTPLWVVERKQVGNRAELYSVQYERANLPNPSQIAWVAQDDEGLGWDVEDRSPTFPRFIEVKGRRDASVIFFLTEREWGKAQELGESYELQFWGEIDLSRDPEAEYMLLRGRGYPLRFPNVALELQSPVWEMVATQWRVTRGAT